MAPKKIWDTFQNEYLSDISPLEFVSDRTRPDTHASELVRMEATIRFQGAERIIVGKGNGPIDAFIDALRRDLHMTVNLVSFAEHAMSRGADAIAMAYVEVDTGRRPAPFGGVGRDKSIVTASLKAIVSAINRSERYEPPTVVA
jgi:2-isopropylmalate synthase